MIANETQKGILRYLAEAYDGPPSVANIVSMFDLRDAKDAENFIKPLIRRGFACRFGENQIKITELGYFELMHS